MSLLAAVSCAKFTRIGTSGEGAPAHGPVPSIEGVPAKPASAIMAPPGVTIGFNQPILGDLDGDGYDDFLVQSSEFDVTDELGRPASNVYVFYGKPQFGANVSIADADASIGCDPSGAFALGDVNGDGFADFSLSQSTGFDLVFGNRTRLAGHYAAGAVGVRWTGKPLPPPFAPDLPIIEAVRAAGDVNGDGVGDLLVTASSDGNGTAVQSNAGFGLLIIDYLVLGARGEWAPGDWDPSWALAAIGHETAHDPRGAGRDYLAIMRALPAGDLDGDGKADLIAAGHEKLYVFYGGSEALEGWVVAESADAVLDPIVDNSRPWDTGFSSGVLLAIGDVDGDGASDLATYVAPKLQISYGRKERWSGSVPLTADFSLELSGTGEQVLLAGAASGDIDSDGFPDLVVMEEDYTLDMNLSMPRVTDTMYRVYGNGTRRLGAHRLGPADVYSFAGLAPEPGPPNSGSFFGSVLNEAPFVASVVSVAGDVDGDGSCEILTGRTDAVTLEGETKGVYLIPSTPRIPD